jgi:4-amino-4-deoxy-L-arabinose transferase-like glycosyltransferase
VIFSDVAYVSYFNSFYTEPAALTFFLASVGLALLLARRRDPPLWLPACFLLCAGLLATSRPQNALLGPLLALLGIRLAWRDRNVSRRSLVVAAAVAVSLVSLWYFRSTPGPLSRIHLYNAVFRELLTNSADPKRDLVELKLPPELDRLVGTTGFTPNAPIAEAGFQRDFFDRIGYGKLATFYAARPGRVWKALERSASHAFELRPLHIGNSARETGRPAQSRTGSFAVWSRAKELLVPARLWFVIAYLVVNLIAALELRLRARSRSVQLAGEIWIAVALVAAFQFSVSAVMDHESRRSLFLFNAASDLLFAALCLRAGTVFAYEPAGWRREMRTAGPSADGMSLPSSRR